MLAVNNQVVGPDDAWHAIATKTNLLIGDQRNIQKREGNEHRVDQGCRGNMQRRRVAEITQETHPVTPMQPAHLGGETHLAPPPRGYTETPL